MQVHRKAGHVRGAFERQDLALRRGHQRLPRSSAARAPRAAGRADPLDASSRCAELPDELARSAGTARTAGTRPRSCATRSRTLEPGASHGAPPAGPRGHELRPDRRRPRRAARHGPLAPAQRAGRAGRPRSAAAWAMRGLRRMNCADAVARLSAALDGELPPADARRGAAHHLDACDACARRFRTLQQVRAAVRSTPFAPVDAAALRRRRARARPPRADRRPRADQRRVDRGRGCARHRRVVRDTDAQEPCRRAARPQRGASVPPASTLAADCRAGTTAG